MPRSRVQPDPIWIRRADTTSSGVQLTLRGRWDIKSVLVETEDQEEKTEYDYKESEIIVQVPENEIAPTLDLDEQIRSWVQTRADSLVSAAKRRYVLETGEAAE